jgi:N-acetylmuramoyl-L-alanine amidase
LQNKIKYIILVFLFSSFTIHASDKLDVIVIDAGHGGKDPGTIGPSGVMEKNINLPIAIKFGTLIENAFPDIKVIYTRTTDVFIEVKDRSVIANNAKAKLFISIHSNYKKKEETDKNGFEVYVLNTDRFPEAISFTMNDNKLLKYDQYGIDTTGKYIYSTLAESGYQKLSNLLSFAIESNLLNLTQLNSRGVMQAGLWVLLGASMPAALVECGYLSDPNDEKYLSSDAGQTAVAKGLFEGFVRFKMIYESE